MKVEARGVVRGLAGDTPTSPAGPHERDATILRPVYDYQPVESCIDYLERGSRIGDVAAGIVLGLIVAITVIAMAVA